MHVHYFRGQPDCSIHSDPEFAPSLPLDETQGKKIKWTQISLIATFNIPLPSAIFRFV